VTPVQAPAFPAIAKGANLVGTKITVDVPPGTGSMSILSQGTNVPVTSVTLNGRAIPNSVVPTMVTDPSQAMLFDDLPVPPPDGSGKPIFYGGLSPFTGMMTVPNTSFCLQRTALQGGIAPGTWTFTVNDFAQECTQIAGCTRSTPAQDTYDIQVLLKPGIPPGTGTVDLAFYFLGGVVADAATAKNDLGFNRMLQTLGKFYAKAGLCLGTVTLYDVPGWAKTKYGGLINADDDTLCGDLSQIFTLAAPGNQVNFFLVTGFKSRTGQGLTVVGVDGTIPGPSAVGGTVSSGASVNGSDLTITGCTSAVDIHNCGADAVAYIVAHEGGHFMGLYHTTEQTGDSFDPLSDTPTCACTTCAPASEQARCAPKNPAGTLPTLVRNESCLRPTRTPACGGGENLMFWLLPGSFNPNPQSVLSAHQGQVIRSNLVVR
jgi:hypothetical protein